MQEPLATPEEADETSARFAEPGGEPVPVAELIEVSLQDENTVAATTAACKPLQVLYLNCAPCHYTTWQVLTGRFV